MRVNKSTLELQKQVEELLNRRIEPKIFHCHADALETCQKVQKAVKDTAKEIFQTLYNYPHKYNEMRIKDIAKKYGIEVEE